MIDFNSPLRRLPPQLDRKQALFFDGIRHSVEIVHLAYSRLQHTLTNFALNYEVTPLPSETFTSAFLDAWAVVDGIDRFRAFWKLMPNTERGPLPPGGTKFEEISQPVRNLRNVADHLAQRADYVIANNGTALGELSWYTALDPKGTEGRCCILVPGTFTAGDRQFVNPAEKTSTYPTGLIHLAAGEHRACLSDILPEIEKRVRFLEKTIEESVSKLGLDGQQAGADIFIAAQIRFLPDGQSPTV
jgi:hypothetical protein